MAKLLIVDDDELMVNMYATKFKDDGYDVITAQDGQDGINKAEAQLPQLILLDVMMPTMDGLTALSKLKANLKTENIPVIMLTNVGGSKEDVEEGLGLGAVAYIIKSHYTPKQVVEKVKEVLGGYTKTLPKVKVTLVDKQKKSTETSEGKVKLIKDKLKENMA